MFLYACVHACWHIAVWKLVRNVDLGKPIRRLLQWSEERPNSPCSLNQGGRMKPEETDRYERVKGPKKVDLPSLGMVGEEECYTKSCS